LQGRLYAPPEEWRRVSSTRPHHWQHVGSHAATRNPGAQEGRSQLPLFFPSSPAMTCKILKQRNRQTILIFFHGFRICFSLFSFRSASLQIDSSMGFLSSPSLRVAWQKKEGWLLICRYRCDRATTGGYWVYERCRREEAGRKSVAEDEEECCPGAAVCGLLAHW